MDMMTLPVWMQMFGIVHDHAWSPNQIEEVGQCAVSAGENHAPFFRRRLSRPKRRSTTGRPYVPRPAANRAAGRSEYGGGLRIHE